MKKIFVGALVALVLVGFAGGMVVSAQTETPPVPPAAPLGGAMQIGQAGDGLGILHDVLVAKLAEATGLAVADIEAKLDAGSTLYTIATEAGLSVEDVQALMLAAREEALPAAVAAGTITQEQADWLASRMFGAGRGGQMGQGMMGQGQAMMGKGRMGQGMGLMNSANCLGTGVPVGGARGGRWAAPQVNPVP